MSVENTGRRSPLENLVGMMGAGIDAYITGMECAGQEQLVKSDQLPAEAHGFTTRWGEDAWPEYEALGFVKGDPVEGDPLFVHATLPPGWSRQGSQHAMGSYIVDERGLQRVSVFYKAAFYDRVASMSMVDPGTQLATEAVYGDDEVAVPQQWPVLTDDERAAFRRHLDHYIESAAECPRAYNDRLPRVRQLKILVGGQK